MFKSALSGLKQFLANENSLKMMNNAFYFTLNILLEYINFLVIYKNGLIRKIRLITKLMTWQPEKTTFGIHILQATWQSRGRRPCLSPSFFEIVLCQGYFLGNLLLFHSARHPKLFWPRHSQNLVGGSVSPNISSSKGIRQWNLVS